MDSNHLQQTRCRDNKHEDGKLLKQVHHHQGKESQAVSFSPASPPSASSSPSHEFSFTISLHSSSTTNTTTIPDKAKPAPPFAIDLSPADDIFFHGHLLPLHLLSHLPVSPRSSTNSMDSFTLPIKDLLMEDQRPSKESNNNINISSNHSISNINNNNNNKSSSNINNNSDDERRGRSRSNSKSFSLFGFTRWRKGCEEVREDKDQKQKRKLRFDVSQVVKLYMRMVQPLLFFKGRRQNVQLRRQPYSFSGNLAFKNKPDLRGRRGEFSAPASMRTSPSNSGLLVATTATTLPSSKSDSTMEELQAAIQAAIAHCKNSIAADDDKLKC